MQQNNTYMKSVAVLAVDSARFNLLLLHSRQPLLSSFLYLYIIAILCCSCYHLYISLIPLFLLLPLLILLLPPPSSSSFSSWSSQFYSGFIYLPTYFGSSAIMRMSSLLNVHKAKSLLKFRREDTRLWLESYLSRVVGNNPKKEPQKPRSLEAMVG